MLNGNHIQLAAADVVRLLQESMGFFSGYFFRCFHPFVIAS